MPDAGRRVIPRHGCPKRHPCRLYPAFKYGYYMDRWLFAEVAELFAENCESLWSIAFSVPRKAPCACKTVRRGNMDRRLEFYRASASAGHGRCGIGAPEHQGRFRCFLTGSVRCSKPDGHGNHPSQFWDGRIYENTYVKEDGVWRTNVLNCNIV